MSKKQKQDQRSEEGEAQKERKVKVVYYDDGSTIADMSGTHRGGKRPERSQATFREKMRTFFSVMKKMVLPLLCTLIGFLLVYMFLMWRTGRL